MKKDKLKKIILLILVEVFVVMLISVITLLCIQTQFFFMPNANEKAFAELLEDESYEEVSIDNNGKRLSGLIKYNYAKDEKAPLIIFFLGNYQNSASAFKAFANCKMLDCFKNYNILIVDYPEYGKSEGKISEKSMFEAAEKVYDYASGLESTDKENIVIFGYSIGTGAATYIASLKEVNGLVLLAPYDEALSLYNANVNIFYGPLKYLTTLKLESYKYAQEVNAKTLIITSYDDEVINYEYSINLSKYFKNLDEIVVLDNNVKHNGYFYEEEALEKITTYLDNK